MCSGGGSGSQSAPVTPAPAPPPAEAPPEEAEIGAARRQQEQQTADGKDLGDLTRIDRAATGGVRGGAGPINPKDSGILM